MGVVKKLWDSVKFLGSLTDHVSFPHSAEQTPKHSDQSRNSQTFEDPTKVLPTTLQKIAIFGNDEDRIFKRVAATNTFQKSTKTGHSGHEDLDNDSSTEGGSLPLIFTTRVSVKTVEQGTASSLKHTIATDRSFSFGAKPTTSSQDVTNIPSSTSVISKESDHSTELEQTNGTIAPSGLTSTRAEVASSSATVLSPEIRPETKKVLTIVLSIGIPFVVFVILAFVCLQVRRRRQASSSSKDADQPGLVSASSIRLNSIEGTPSSKYGVSDSRLSANFDKDLSVPTLGHNQQPSFAGGSSRCGVNGIKEFPRNKHQISANEASLCFETGKVSSPRVFAPLAPHPLDQRSVSGSASNLANYHGSIGQSYPKVSIMSSSPSLSFSDAFRSHNVEPSGNGYRGVNGPAAQAARLSRIASVNSCGQIDLPTAQTISHGESQHRHPYTDRIKTVQQTCPSISSFVHTRTLTPSEITDSPASGHSETGQTYLPFRPDILRKPQTNASHNSENNGVRQFITSNRISDNSSDIVPVELPAETTIHEAEETTRMPSQGVANINLWNPQELDSAGISSGDDRETPTSSSQSTTALQASYSHRTNTVNNTSSKPRSAKHEELWFEDRHHRSASFPFPGPQATGPIQQQHQQRVSSAPLESLA